jgi:hypothetical protein
MAISSDTPTNLVVGAGEVYANGIAIGASTGDNVFRIERDLFSPELNGTKGKLIGTDYVVRSEGFLEVTLPEVSAEILAAGWPGSNSTGSGTVIIDEDDSRRLETADYNDWELQVERLGGGEFQFECDDAIQTANFEGTLTNAGLFAPRYTLASRWDPADLTVSPFRIRVMDVAS